MQISSIVDIVGGKLLNSPAISFITQIHTSASKVNDGDLFIVKNKSDIEVAIKNGAFAILLDFDTQVIDDEIAWIKVEDITVSQIKLLRFILSHKNIESFYCDDISFELLNIYAYLNKNMFLLTDIISKDFEVLKNISSNSLVISTNEKYMRNIQPLAQELKTTNAKIENLTQHSLFNTTFSYRQKLFYKLRIPSMYINNFLLITEFLGMELDIYKLKSFKYFSPIFINKYFEIVDFGKSNKFILANKNRNLIDTETKFLKDNYSYAKVIIIDKYKDDNELFNYIKNCSFNALYIKGKSQEEIIRLLEENKKDLTTLI